MRPEAKTAGTSQAANTHHGRPDANTGSGGSRSSATIVILALAMMAMIIALAFSEVPNRNSRLAAEAAPEPIVVTAR